MDAHFSEIVPSQNPNLQQKAGQENHEENKQTVFPEPNHGL